MDSQFIGSVINALPLEHMIGGPLQAMIKAQVQASKAYADFLLSVCIKDGKAEAVQFDYDETVVDEKGVIQGVVKKTMRIPLLAAISHPNISIEEGTIDFELEVSQSESSNSETAAEASLEASVGWGPFSVKISGRVSHKAQQTRSTDTRAKYSIHTQVKRQPPPEALMRVIDFLTDAATRPAILPSEAKKLDDKTLDAYPVTPVAPATPAGNNNTAPNRVP
ncbi:DUF2589 domain-containing protein [Cronobacter turicensis]|uniref:DUF2589 domain-containing protein n=1 Tax=Cronobacter turicensis TaxID=413502 RepID=UPI000CFDA4D4|nr:DUF2589 domain-containing protein [Cronobacter turicensis]EKM5758951.1 DUF2589 domain-containing protein [Cronobacter turicensis]NUW57297.1 DUF2589 domain-containing protein [Cronobacter turicensis]